MDDHRRDVVTEKPYEQPTGERRGLLIINTGDGKGKTTAAIGLAIRAKGRGFTVKIYQFMKHESAQFGEHRSLKLLDIPIEGLGDGFSWTSQDLSHSAKLALEGWQRAKALILSGECSMVVLDEVTYPIQFGWIDLDDVVQALRERPKHVHVVLTGRGAAQALIDIADTVSEVKAVKHAFDAGIPAQRGIEH